MNLQNYLNTTPLSQNWKGNILAFPKYFPPISFKQHYMLNLLSVSQQFWFGTIQFSTEFTYLFQRIPDFDHVSPHKK